MNSDRASELFDPAPVGVALTSGPDHRLGYTNPAFRRILEGAAPELPVREAFGRLLRKKHLDLFDRVVSTGVPFSLDGTPVDLHRPGGEGEERFYSFNLSRTSADEPGLLLLIADTTEQVTAARKASLAAEEQHRAVRRFQSLVQTSADIIWVTSPRGEIIEPTPSFTRVTGLTWEEYRGRGWEQLLHPDDRESTLRSWDRSLREGRPMELVHRLRVTDGSYRHFKVDSAPVHDGGTVVEWIGTHTDIEERWRAERRRELLEHAAVATAERTDLREMLGALADVLVPAIADGCRVYLLPDFADHSDGGPVTGQSVAATARAGLPRQPPFDRELFAADSGFIRTVRRRRTVHRTFPPGCPPQDLLPKGTRDFLVRAGSNSVVMLPVIVDGTVAAVVTASTTSDREPISQDDIGLMGQLFDLAHDALSSAMQHQRTHQVALALQHGLLPDPPTVPGSEIVARYLASPATAEVGGDWYDSFVLPDNSVVLAIGDVAGHDLSAAVAMSQLRNMLRCLIVDRAAPPGEILHRLNIVMTTLTPDGTATCALAKVTAAGPADLHVSYAAAGHPPPLLAGADGRTRLLDDGANPMLGLGNLYDQPYRSTTVRLPPDHTLLLYTDGLVERPGEGLNEGLSRLCEEASILAREQLGAFCDGLISRLPTAGIDDLAMIALRRSGREPGSSDSEPAT